MKRLAACALLLAACRFAIDGTAVEMAVPGDGAPLDANVELDTPPDLGPDLSMVELGHVPDGALPRQVGYPCAAASDCANGQCIDGYCCETLCDPFDPANKCMACNVPGAEGHCVAALDGTDPRGLCDQMPQSSCAQDGACDGSGACRKWGRGTPCGPTSCAGGVLTGPNTCDGLGACVPSTTSSNCDPYTCAAGGLACNTSCTGTGMSPNCAAGATCMGGLCNGQRGLGQSCTAPAQCQSGFCSQGVCCGSDCSGPCRSCALAASPGLCLFMAAGTDPLNDCTASTRASCGLDGTCDGAGICVAGGSASCSPYACDPASGACLTSCASSADCTAGTCKGHMCK
jgi:hypothetical protein